MRRRDEEQRGGETPVGNERDHHDGEHDLDDCVDQPSADALARVGRWALGLRRGVPPGLGAWRVAGPLRRVRAAGRGRPRLRPRPLERGAAMAAPANPAAAVEAMALRRPTLAAAARATWLRRRRSGCAVATGPDRPARLGTLLAGLALVRGGVGSVSGSPSAHTPARRPRCTAGGAGRSSGPARAAPSSAPASPTCGGWRTAR